MIEPGAAPLIAAEKQYLLNNYQKPMIGSLALISNIVSRPELNGRIANVAISRFSVRVRLDHKSSVINLKTENLTPVNPLCERLQDVNALCVFPLARLKQGCSPSSGSRVDVPAGRLSIFTGVSLNHACLLRGQPTEPDHNGVYTPVSILTTQVNVECVDPDTCIELHDLDLHLPQTSNELTLLNCVIRSTKAFGVEAREGGILVVRNCTIKNTGMAGVAGYCKAGFVTLSDSSISGSGDSAVLLCDGVPADIKGCLLERARMAGIAVDHNVRGRVQIERCRISHCMHGLLTQTGSCRVQMTQCHISNCSMYGVFVGTDCLGEVRLDQVHCEACKIRNFQNDTQPEKCRVLLDGVALDNNSLDVHLPRATKEAVVRHAHAVAGTNSMSERARKDAGLEWGLPTCHGCGITEPPGTKYLRCSQCNQTCYCSKMCQKTDWPAHKITCQIKAKYPAFLDCTTDIRNLK